MSVERLNKNISKKINSSSDVEFANSRMNDSVRHTAIVLKFDGIPFFTLDYGANETNSTPATRFLYHVAGSSQSSATAINFLASGSAIAVSPFDCGATAIIGNILKFALNTETGSKRAVDLLEKIADIYTGDYSLTGNNCRDFVEKANDIIATDERKRKQVQQEIATTRREDAEFALATGMAVAAAGVLGKAFYDWWASPSSEPQQISSRSQRQ